MLPLGLMFLFLAIGSIWLEIEDKDDHLSVKYGPMRIFFCCRCQKSEIKYSDILEWTVAGRGWSQQRSQPFGWGYTAKNCKCAHVLEFGVCSEKIEIKLKPNNESNECVNYVKFTSKHSEELFKLLKTKCKGGRLV